MPTQTSLPLVVANWKMNLSLAASVALARKLRRMYTTAKLKQQVELVLCPTYPALAGVRAALKGSPIALGAQDVFWKGVGPYTGEVSPEVLKELGVSYVIVGHSERRQYLKETDAMVQQKVLASLAAQMVPILCVGETYAERQAGNHEDVIAHQVRAGLSGAVLLPGARLVVAYEPVWVIGSGQAVNPLDAQKAGHVIQETVAEFIPKSQLKQVILLYGGSVNPANIITYVNHDPLQGVLVGGASLEANQFSALLTTFA